MGKPPINLAMDTLGEDGVVPTCKEMFPRELAILVLDTVAVEDRPFPCRKESRTASTNPAHDLLCLAVLHSCLTALVCAQHIEVWRKSDRHMKLPSHGN